MQFTAQLPQTYHTLDAADELKAFRTLFYIPANAKGEEVIYLCGNSLGLQPKTAEQYVQQELNDWKTLGVEGHFHARHAWYGYHHLDKFWS